MNTTVFDAVRQRIGHGKEVEPSGGLAWMFGRLPTRFAFAFALFVLRMRNHTQNNNNRMSRSIHTSMLRTIYETHRASSAATREMRETRTPSRLMCAPVVV